MKKIAQIAVVGLALGSGACSSIIDGTSQEILVNTNPAGAKCVLSREGASIATIDPTPAAVTVKKNKHDITIVCTKDGFQETTVVNNSGVAGATLGNIILGGGIGWAIDSASGADNKYDSPVNITLTPAAPTPAAAAPVAPPAPLTN